MNEGFKQSSATQRAMNCPNTYNKKKKISIEPLNFSFYNITFTLQVNK